MKKKKNKIKWVRFSKIQRYWRKEKKISIIEVSRDVPQSHVTPFTGRTTCLIPAARVLLRSPLIVKQYCFTFHVPTKKDLHEYVHKIVRKSTRGWMLLAFDLNVSYLSDTTHQRIWTLVRILSRGNIFVTPTFYECFLSSFYEFFCFVLVVILWVFIKKKPS